MLTVQAAALLGIKTVVVRKAATGGAQATVVPASALVYEPDGTVWVYTTGDPADADADAADQTETFVRVAVTVARINGDSAELKSGPPAGTLVVTVGGAELQGTEDGVEGG